MYLWIVDFKRGITLLFYSSLELPIDESLISGLLSAINQLTLVEFKQPIESINMGGFKWIYILDLDLDLMFVASEPMDVSSETIKGRLSFIKDIFIRQFVYSKEEWEENWTGEVEKFKPFVGTIDGYYQQWSQAEDVDMQANFYDVIGIFQQILNLLKNVVNNNTSGDKQEVIYNKISTFYEKFKSLPDNQKEAELNKIEYSRKAGFNIFNLNPMGCDVVIIKKQLQKLILDLTSILKEELGHDTCLALFRKEELFNYIINNLILIKKLKLDNYLLQVLLRE